MILYHGSYTQIENPQVELGRDKVDFGKGFYLTSLREQAEKWARVVAIRKGPLYLPVVSSYVLDYEALTKERFVLKIFEKYDKEWLEYVVDCRKGGKMQEQYDLVEGGVANDNVIDTVEDYENGRITAEQALGQLQYKAVNHQICIRRQEIIDDFLTYLAD